MNVALIILNWNGASLLSEYLPPTIQAINQLNQVELIVADNGSTDHSLELLATDFPNVTVISLDENYGFAEGYNRAIEQVDAELICLLNSDAFLVENTVEIMREAFMADPNLGAAQPKIKAIRNPNQFEYAGAAGGMIDQFGFPYCRGRIMDNCEEDLGQYNDSKYVLWASGACLFVRKEVFLSVGKLDSDFFAHMEEIDLCWRIWRYGYTVKSIGSSEAFHYGGASLDASSPRKTYLNFRNNLVLLWKHWSTSELILKLIPRLILDGLIGVIWLLQGRKAHTWAIIRAHNHFFRTLPLWNPKRKELRHLPYALPKEVNGKFFLLF